MSTAAMVKTMALVSRPGFHRPNARFGSERRGLQVVRWRWRGGVIRRWKWSGVERRRRASFLLERDGDLGAGADAQLPLHLAVALEREPEHELGVLLAG